MMPPMLHARRLKALRRALASAGDKAEDVGQNGGGRAGFSQQQAHAVEAANGMFRGHAACAPSRLGLDALDAGQRQPGPVLILECDRRRAEALRGRIVGDALLDQALGPVADRAFRNAEDGLLRLPDPEPARRRALPCEEGQDRARMAGRIAVVEVIGAGVVEIDRLLDQAQAKRPRVEIEVPARRACDARHMMDAARHASSSFASGRLYAFPCRRPTWAKRRALRPSTPASESKPPFGSRSRQRRRQRSGSSTARRRRSSKAAPLSGAVRPALASNTAAPPRPLALAR